MGVEVATTADADVAVGGSGVSVGFGVGGTGVGVSVAGAGVGVSVAGNGVAVTMTIRSVAVGGGVCVLVDAPVGSGVGVSSFCAAKISVSAV